MRISKSVVLIVMFLGCWLVYPRSLVAIIASSGVDCHSDSPFESQAFSTESLSDDEASSDVSINLGFANSVRLGHWSPIQISSLPRLVTDQARFLAVTCVDGEDIEVTYEQPIAQNAGSTIEGGFRLGRPRGTITIRLLDANRNVLFESSREVGEQPGQVRPVVATAKLILGVNQVPEFRRPDKINDAYSDELGTIFITATAPGSLPENWRSLQSLDTIVIALSTRDQIEQLGRPKLEAINEWVRRGGKLLIWVPQDSVGDSSASEKLSCFGKISNLKSGEIRRLSAIERFVDATTPIEMSQPVSLVESNLPLIPVISQDGRVIVGRYSWGMGTITFCGLALDQAPLANWKSTPALLEKLMELSAAAEAETGTSAGRLIDNGYRDLAGQVRVPLENFRSVQFIPFTAVALLIGLFILLIGPGDYFLLRALGRRMHWTWLTFPLATLSFCGVAILLNQSLKSSDDQLNLIEVVDIDSASERLVSHIWCGIYSPRSKSISVRVSSSGLEQTAGDISEISWMGNPGSGLGGMQTSRPELTSTSGYSNFRRESRGQKEWTLEKFPLGFSSVRTLAGIWTATTHLKTSGKLRRSRKLDRLEGQISNPLLFRLTNPRLFYGDSVFTIDRNLEPGDVVDVFTEMKERTIKNFFANRSGDATKEGNRAQAWNPADTNATRILQLMMLHDAVGGQSYSGLSNRYWTGVEISDRLLPDRAVLVAEVSETFSRLEIDGQDVSSSMNKSISVVRLFIPVEIELSAGEQK